MITPGEGGGESFERAPQPQKLQNPEQQTSFQGVDFQESEAVPGLVVPKKTTEFEGTTFNQAESGLVYPEGTNVPEQIPTAQETPEERKAKIDAKLPEEKRESINTGLAELQNLDLLKVDTPEDFIDGVGADAAKTASDEVINEAKSKARAEAEARGVTDEDQLAAAESIAVQKAEAEAQAAGAAAGEAEKTRAEKLMDRVKGAVGMTFAEFKKANEGTSSELLIEFLFNIYSNPDGRIGTGGLTELKGGLEESDAYLVQELEGGGKDTLKKFFTIVLGRDTDNLDNIDELMNQVYSDVKDKEWDSMEKKLSEFLLTQRSASEDYSFNKDNIKRVFKILSEKNADELRGMFNLETNETSGEADDGTDDSDASKNDPGQAKVIPINQGQPSNENLAAAA
jgi:hypothetical protein